MEEFLIYLLKSAGLITAFLLFYNLLLKKDTTFITNRRFLIGGILTSAILPAIYFTKTVIIKVQPSQFQLNEAIYPVSDTVIQEQPLSILEIFAGIYILGVIVMSIRLLFQLLSLTRIIFSGKISAKNGKNFIETSRNIPPFSFLSYVVYNPDSHSKNELVYILKHEQVHVKQRHTLDVLLANLNLIYQWFNPFAWMYLKSIQQNLEFIADREVVKKAGCKKEYQKTLVRISVENFNLTLANNFYQSLIKKRIVMLNKSSSNAPTLWKSALIVPALIAFIFFFNIKTVAQIQTEEQDTIISDELSTNLEVTLEIKNTANEEQLASYSKLMKKYNVDLEFENIQRNDAGLITAITAKFLDKNNNSTGSVSRENKDGIKGFVFSYNEDEGSGFKSIDATPPSHEYNLSKELGEEPLIIIAGKQYTTSQLAGKSVHITGDVSSVSSREASKKYGDIGKDGAFIISEGNVIDDFNGEMKEIDKQEKDALNRYIKFEEGKRPIFISVNKNAGVANIKSGSHSYRAAGSGTAGTIRNFNLGNPVYVVNGKVLGGQASIDTINPESISGIHVLKGYSATSVYGKDAKDGAIVITTRKAGDTTGFDLKKGTIFVKDSIRTNNVNYRSSNVNLVDFDSINPTRRKFTVTTSNAKYNNTPVYVINGKKMETDFKVTSVNPDEIKMINVIKGTEAIEKYGEKAKGGAVEITTQNNQVIDMGSMVVITPSATQKALNEFQNILKDAGVQTEFSKIKRNKEGILTDLQITAKYKGRELTASFSEKGGIPGIMVGLVNDQLMISTKDGGINKN